MIEYKLVSFNETSKDFQDANNAEDFEYSSILTKCVNGVEINHWTDNIEPEDATFDRDLGLFIDELQELTNIINEQEKRIKELENK